MGAGAGGAAAAQFEGGARRREPRLVGEAADERVDARFADLADGAAVVADQEAAGFVMIGAGAGHVGVARLDAVRDVHGGEAGKRAIDRLRRGDPLVALRVEDLVGGQRAAMGAQQRQHPVRVAYAPVAVHEPHPPRRGPRYRAGDHPCLWCYKIT